MESDLLNVFCETLIKDVKLHPVKLELIFDENIDYNAIRDILENKEDEEIIEKYNWDSLVRDKNTKNLYIYSTDTGNDDTRGGGCGDAGFTEEDFIWETSNENGITLRDVVEGCYRLKGSKYDYWYELFGEIVEEKSSDDSTIRFKVSYGYGS